MKKFFSVVLLALAVVWLVMVIFKCYLAISGYMDFNGRGPQEHLTSAFFQLLLAVGAYKLAMHLRRKLNIENQERF
jgi:hypothetical protein